MTDELDPQSMTDEQLSGLIAEAGETQEPPPAAAESAQEPPRKETQHLPLAELPITAHQGDDLSPSASP